MTGIAIEHDTPEWHEARRLRVGGSDVPTILGLNPWESPYSLWARKTGRTEPDDNEGNDYIEFGHRAEPMLIQWFEDDTGLRVGNAQEMWTHPDNEWHGATIDGLVYEGPTDGEPIALYEAKTTGAVPSDDWWRRVEAQCQWGMYVTETLACWVTVLVGRRVEHREIARDDAWIAHTIEAVNAFIWHVQADEPPPADDSEATGRALAQVHPGDKDMPAVTLDAELVGRAASLKRAIKEMTTELTGIENEIKEALGDATVGICGHDVAVRWTPIESTRWDTKALEAEHPELADTYKRESSYRRMTITWEG